MFIEKSAKPDASVSARHAQQNHDRQQYRMAARQRLSSIPEIAVPTHAHVAVCEGGAFVECVVWVPSDALDG